MNEEWRNIFQEIAMSLERETQIIQESENRVDNFNEMIKNMSALMKELKDEYVKHINQVCQNRDEVAKQNSLLMQQNVRLQNKIDRMAKEKDELCQEIRNSKEEFITYLKQQAQHHPSINVNHG